MADRAVGVGLISVGWMGRAHSRAYRAVHENYPDLAVRPRLVVAADVVDANRRAATQLLGYAESTADYQDVPAHPEVDVVSICAPNSLHREMALAAAAAGHGSRPGRERRHRPRRRGALDPAGPAGLGARSGSVTG